MPEHVPILVEQMDTANRDVLLFPVPAGTIGTLGHTANVVVASYQLSKSSFEPIAR